MQQCRSNDHLPETTMIRRLVVAASLLAVSAAPVLAGPVNSYSFDRVFVFADALTQFIGGSTVLTDEPPAFNGVFDPPDVPHAFGVDSALLPFSGGAKDGAQGHAGGVLLLQTGTADDVFTFHFSGSASAEEAFAASGDPASAYVDLNAGFHFRIDEFTAAGPAGTFVGNLDLDALRAATPYETITVQVSSLGHGVIRTLHAGDPGGSVALLSGDTYTLDLSYQMRVPHGVDPEFVVDFGARATLAPVPEPSTWVLVGLGLAGIAFVVRRRAG